MSYNPNDNAKVKDIVSLAQYASAKIDSLMADLPAASMAGGGALDTTPSTVDGGLWYELDNSAPVIKFYQAGLTYSLTPTLDVIDPQLTVTPSTATIESGSATATLSYAGSGSVSLSCNYNNITPTYNSSTKVITVPYSASAADDSAVVTTVSLSANGAYSAATATFTVQMTVPHPGDNDTLIPDDIE